jgi:CubicO group peptidase (beta-lactamase class C family)
MRKRIMIVFLCFSVIFTGMLLNGGIVSAEANDKTLPSGLKYSELKQAVENYIGEHKATTASAAISVFDREGTINQTYYGYTDRENQIKADKDSVYEWGSTTKLLVWVSVMQLWEQGKINLEEDVAKYLPEGFLNKRRYQKPITMINLMNHNAGFDEVITDVFLRDKEDIKELGEMVKYTQTEQVYEPGTVEAYSNWSVALASYIVERISGETFSDYVHNNIFKPIGMEHTAILPTLEDNEWVKEQRRKLQAYTADTVSLLPDSFYYIGLYPVGMCTGTLGDFERFAKELVVKDGKASRLFEKSSTLKEMLSPTMYFSGTKIAQNCHGFWTIYLGVQTLGHGGNTAGCSSYILVHPESGVGVVVMTNQRNEKKYNVDFMKLIYGQYKYDGSLYTTPDIESTKGIYMNARTITKGPLSIMSFLVTKPVSKYSEDSYSTFSVYSSENGITKKSESYHSSIRLSFGKYVLQCTLIILALISFIYSLVTLAVGGIRAIKRKMSKRLKKEHPFRNYNNIECGLILLFIVNFTAVFGRVIFYTTWADIRWQIVLNAVLMILILLNTILLALKLRKVQAVRSEKVKCLVTAVMGLIIFINIIYWEMYKFQ